MSDELLLGIDVGTSATKAVLARPDGEIVARTSRPHGLSLPRPGWAEHDAEGIWWQDVLAVCADLAPRAGTALRAVAVSGIGPCVVPCDARLRPLRPAILYGIDTRATAEIAELEETLGAAEILARGGSALSSQALGPKLLWLRRHEPEVWERTAVWCMASSFVAARLTGEVVLDRHSASQCDPLYDLAAAGWADDWAAEIAGGVPLPRLADPGEPVGVVSATAAAETGLPAGIPVMAGTIDAWAEAHSVGVRHPGDLMLMLGSTLFAVQVAEDARPHELLWLTEGVEPGRRTFAAGMSTSGSLTDWVRRLAGDADWRELAAEAAAAPPGANGLLMLPYFAGERTPIYDPEARGVLAGLTLRHGRGDLLRAAYEATAFGTRQILELFAEAAGPAQRVVVVGGGVRSPTWLRILASVAGVRLDVPAETVGAAYGDALLAATGAGLVPPGTTWARTVAFVEPEPATQPVYDELYELYGRLYAETAEIVHRLGRFAAAPEPTEPMEATHR